MSEKFDVFLSAADEDSEVARELSDYLESKGLNCVSSGSFGSSPHEIAEAIAVSRSFVLVISSHTKDSSRTALELERAFKVEKTIFPYVIEDCDAGADFNFVLSRTQAILAYKKESESYEKLAAAVLKAAGTAPKDDTTGRARNKNRKRRRILIIAAAVVLAGIITAVILSALSSGKQTPATDDDVTETSDNTVSESQKKAGLFVDYDPESHSLALSGADIDDYSLYTLTKRPWNNVASVLSSVTAGEDVTVIGSNAFRECTALKTVVLGADIRALGDYSFALCGSLETVTLPEGIESIGERAFNSCYALSEINIPDTVTSIGKGAFEYCRSLSEITVPASVTEIGNDAFNNTYNKTIIIHTVKGSAADKFAEKNGLSVVYD